MLTNNGQLIPSCFEQRTNQIAHFWRLLLSTKWIDVASKMQSSLFTNERWVTLKYGLAWRTLSSPLEFSVDFVHPRGSCSSVFTVEFEVENFVFRLFWDLNELLGWRYWFLQRQRFNVSTSHNEYWRQVNTWLFVFFHWLLVRIFDMVSISIIIVVVWMRSFIVELGFRVCYRIWGEKYSGNILPWHNIAFFACGNIDRWPGKARISQNYNN